MAKKGGATRKPKESAPTKVADTTFTEPELQALQQIVTDWIGEQIVAAPYPPVIASVIRKLGIPRPEQPSGAAPRTISTAESTLPGGPAPLIPNLG